MRSSSSYSIPTTINKPPTQLSDYAICIYGLKNIGKSSLAAEFPSSFTLCTEVGRRSIACRMVPQVEKGKKPKPLDWEDIVGYTDAAIEDDSVDTIVYDTIDKTYLLCQRHYCDLLGIEHPNDAKDYGATHTRIAVEFAKVMDAVKQAGKTPVWLSHSAYRENYDALEETKSEMLIPSCQKAAWSYLQTAADFVFCYLMRKNERVMVIRRSETIEAACGTGDLPAFLDVRTGKPLAEVSMGRSPKEAYRNLELAFQNKMTGRLFEPPKSEESAPAPVKKFKLNLKKK